MATIKLVQGKMLPAILRDRIRSMKKAAKSNPELAQFGTWDKNMMEYLLKHGKAHPFRPRPKGVRKGKPKNCYDNAARLSVQKGWTYCEGFSAIQHDDGRVFEFQHAWCLDGEGFVVDPTTDGVEYFGLPIDLDRSDVLQLQADQRNVFGVPTLTLLANPLT